MSKEHVRRRMYPKLPHTSTISQFQEYTRENSIRLEPRYSAFINLNYILQEWDEFVDAVATGDRTLVGAEIPDIIIFIGRCADQFNISLEETINRQFTRLGLPKIRSINEFQDTMDQVFGKFEDFNDPSMLMDGFISQHRSLESSIETGHLGIIENSIFSLLVSFSRLASLYRVDLEEACNNKMQRNRQKYPYELIEDLVKQYGITYKDARLVCRKTWDPERDKEFSVKKIRVPPNGVYVA